MRRMILISALTLVACSDAPTVPATSSLAPVHLTVAGHIEDDARYLDCAEYLTFRAKLLDFADFIASYGVAFRLQASYEWFLGVAACETDAVKGELGGMTSLDHLAETYGFAIDTHQEGAAIGDATSGNNFADIRWAGEQVTSHMSEVTGFQWDNPQQYAKLQAGEAGLLHPTFTWTPEILAGGVSVLHTDGNFDRDMDSVGVWVPSGFSESSFHEHDTSDTARMVYVGSGPNQWAEDWGPSQDCHYQTTADYVEVIADQVSEGGGPYTTTFFIPQRVMFDPAEWAKVRATLDQLAPLIEDGRVVHAHYEAIVERWREDGGQPFILRYEDLPTDRRTCP